jgi:hypothetical protein
MSIAFPEAMKSFVRGRVSEARSIGARHAFAHANCRKFIH